MFRLVVNKTTLRRRSQDSRNLKVSIFFVRDSHHQMLLEKLYLGQAWGITFKANESQRSWDFSFKPVSEAVRISNKLR